MKIYKLVSFLTVLFAVLAIVSCKKKKLIEVVEVPLPTKEEKMTMGKPEDEKAEEGSFELYALPFQYDALAPNIDALTMETHYAKYYLNYTNKFNAKLKGSEDENVALDDILKKTSPSDELSNDLGGYYNHTLFFENLKPKKTEVADTLAGAINKTFSSFNGFKNQFIEKAESITGSGWAWLIVNKTGQLEIITTPNNENPMMRQQLVQGKPIIALDMWEHAYFFNYQNRKRAYIEAFFNCIDWDKALERYEQAIKN